MTIVNKSQSSNDTFPTAMPHCSIYGYKRNNTARYAKTARCLALKSKGIQGHH